MLKKINTHFNSNNIIFFIFRLLFCYTILPTSNSGDKKHKTNNVYYFPTFFFNPFKKNHLRKIIYEFANNDDFKTYSQNERILQWDNIIKKNEFKLVSIKEINNTLHLLVESTEYEATLVFILKNDEVIKFY